MRIVDRAPQGRGGNCRGSQPRAVLLERGVDSDPVAPRLEQHLAAMLDADADTTLSPRIRRLIEDMRAEGLERPRSWPRSAMAEPSRVVAISQPGSGWLTTDGKPQLAGRSITEA
jgi:hypothetical protein